MRRKFLAVALLGLLTSCSTSMIHVDAIADTTLIILEQYDVYVEADPVLNDLERRIYLRDSELLRGVIEEAQR